MAEEFKIEKDGNEITVLFRRPNRDETKKYRRTITKLQKEMKKLPTDENKMSEEDQIARVELTEKFEEEMLAVLVILNRDGNFKEVKDFDNVSQPDLARLYGWLNSNLTASMDTGFLPKSEQHTK